MAGVCARFGLFLDRLWGMMDSMRSSLCLLVVLATFTQAATPAAVPTPDVSKEVYRAGAAGMVMDLAFTTAAAPEKIWAAIATSEGLGRWAGARGLVELKVGGAYEIYFQPDNPPGKRGMEGNKILSFMPGRMLSYSGGLPNTWVVYLIEPVASGTRVRFQAAGTNSEWEAKCAEQLQGVAAFIQGLASYLKK
jgi:uncharacterized protein YndB with AHSA1/START domain